nr:MAG TPA: hypothetical protein [Caudoviricetes sp.]
MDYTKAVPFGARLSLHNLEYLLTGLFFCSIIFL